MYSVHVTPGRSTDRNKSSGNMENEIRAYGARRKESIPVKLKNYIRSQFQPPDATSGESEKISCISNLNSGIFLNFDLTISFSDLTRRTTFSSYACLHNL